jgi:transferase CAF17, mitochondrial
MRVAQEIGTHDEGAPDDYLLHRIAHGVPEGAVDIPPMQAFPMESNLDVMGAGESNWYHVGATFA